MPTGAYTPTMQVDRPSTGQTVGDVVAISGLTCNESSIGAVRCTQLVFDSVEITITDALAYVGTKIYDFPAGIIRVLDAAASFTLTTTSDIASTLNSGVTVNWSVGTVTASNATLATTMIDILPGSSGTLPAFTSSTTISVASAQDDDYLKHADAQDAGAIWNGISTAKDMYFNLAVPTATNIDGDATVEVDGILTVYWLLLHDGSLT